MPYNYKVSLLNPTLNVNDKNFNLPISELKENIDYAVTLLNGNNNIKQLLFGNLWDYNLNGEIFLNNGGKLDSYKKCHVFSALNEFKVVNDTRILFDSVGNRLVYTEIDNTTNSPSPSWIEREIYIPTYLRGQQLLLSIKTAGSSVSSNWSSSNSVDEIIGIQILGSSENINEFHTVGIQSQFTYYNPSRYTPEMTTVSIPFTTNLDTSSVKIKIFRTTTSNYLHIDRIFIGGFSLPYVGFDLGNTDINEYFDFDNNIVKINSTTVLGRTVVDSSTMATSSFNIHNLNKSDIVTYEGLIKFLRELILENTVIETSAASITSNSFNYINLYQGNIQLNPGQRIYEIQHGVVKSNIIPNPHVNIVAPNIPIGQITGSSNVFFVHSLFDVTQSGFKVILSDSPTISGYSLNWNIGNTFSPVDAVGYLPIVNFKDTSITGNDIIFTYEDGN